MLRDHTGGISSTALSPDGRLVAVVSADNMARWSMFANTQDLVDAAKAAVPHCLTQEERAEFGLPPEPPKWCIEMGKWPY